MHAFLFYAITFYCQIFWLPTFVFHGITACVALFNDENALHG